MLTRVVHLLTVCARAAKQPRRLADRPSRARAGKSADIPETLGTPNKVLEHGHRTNLLGFGGPATVWPRDVEPTPRAHASALFCKEKTGGSL